MQCVSTFSFNLFVRTWNWLQFCTCETGCTWILLLLKIEGFCIEKNWTITKYEFSFGESPSLFVVWVWSCDGVLKPIWSWHLTKPKIKGEVRPVCPVHQAANDNNNKPEPLCTHRSLSYSTQQQPWWARYDLARHPTAPALGRRCQIHRRHQHPSTWTCPMTQPWEGRVRPPRH
jgi:hypothetical protein